MFQVHATKPSASRAESAEIFVVCQGYVAPDRLDPRFLDPKYVFEELEIEPKIRASDIMHPEKQKKARAEGYRAGDYTQHKTITAKEFIQNSNGVEALAGLAEVQVLSLTFGKTCDYFLGYYMLFISFLDCV